MHRRSIRIVALVLCALFLCPMLLCLAAGAEPENAGRRFMFEALKGEETALNENGSVSLFELSHTQTLTTMGARPVGSGVSSNALYISLHNKTAATLYLTVSYSTNRDAAPQTVEFVFAPSTQKSAQWKYAPYIASMKGDSEMQLELRFEGELSEEDSVTLYSFYDISMYDQNEEIVSDTDWANWVDSANIEHCYYEPGATAEEGVIRISGTIQSFFEEDESSSLALFAFGPDDQDTSGVITKTPVARMAINKFFSFTVAAPGAEEIHSRYAVALITKEGKRNLLCRPTYPDVAAADVPENQGFKGFHTDSMHTVLDSGADLEIVDVYLDRLLLRSSDSSDSILYAGQHSYYFFNKNEIQALDQRVRNLSGNGCEVYLRFLVSGTATGLSYVNQADTQEGIVNMGVDIKSEAALLEIHAITDFLTDRYCGNGGGKISGIILGRSADQSLTYANVGMQSLAAYSKKFATYLNLVAGAARNNISSLRIVVPISDRPHGDTVEINNLAGDYFADLFLESLLLAMEGMIRTPADFTVMLESHEGNMPTEPDDMDNVLSFIDTVGKSAAQHTFLDGKVLYAWNPSAQYTSADLQAAYAFRYIALFFREDVRSFIVDLSLNREAQAVSRELKYLLSVIDTPQGSALLKEITESYGYDFGAYDPTALIVKYTDKANITQNGYEQGRTPTGSYTLFDASRSDTRSEWLAGSSCDGVSVIDRTLVAKMRADGSDEYAGITYAFGGLKNYSVAPLMRFSLGIAANGANASTLYEVQIRLRGANRTLLATTVISAGETQMLYLDLSGYTKNLEQLGSICILVRPLDGSAVPYELKLNTVTLESTTLNSTELAEQIAIHINEGEGEQASSEDRDYTTPILITVFVVFFSLLLIAAVTLRHLRSKRRTKS